jgi:hypothetical protein
MEVKAECRRRWPVAVAKFNAAALVVVIGKKMLAAS